MASCMIALLPAAAYADAEVTVPETVTTQPAIEEPAGDDVPNIEDIPEETLPSEEESSDNTAPDAPEGAEIPEEESLTTTVPDQTGENAAEPPETNVVPEPDPRNSILDIARSRIVASKRGEMINLSDLKIPSTEQESLLHGFVSDGMSVTFYDDGEYVIAIVIESEKKKGSEIKSKSKTDNHQEVEEAYIEGFPEPEADELEFASVDIPKNEAEDDGIMFMSFLTVVFAGLLKVITIIF